MAPMSVKGTRLVQWWVGYETQVIILVLSQAEDSVDFHLIH